MFQRIFDVVLIVQKSQTSTVDRQMKRYGVPRIAFINKCDRSGSDPTRCITGLREKLGLNAVAVQVQHTF